MSDKRLVFVSHSGEDTWVARQIAREIAKCGARPFLDADHVDIGADFEEEIRDSLNKADELVVLFTPWALDRPYIWMEIGGAWLIRRIPIIVIRLVPVDNSLIFINFMSLLRAKRTDSLTNRFFLLSIWPV